MIFTPEQIRDARENPKVGDVWGNSRWDRKICRVTLDEVIVAAVYESKLSITTRYLYISPATFRRWTRNATLLRRGA